MTSETTQDLTLTVSNSQATYWCPTLPDHSTSMLKSLRFFLREGMYNEAVNVLYAMSVAPIAGDPQDENVKREMYVDRDLKLTYMRLARLASDSSDTDPLESAAISKRLAVFRAVFAREICRQPYARGSLLRVARRHARGVYSDTSEGKISRTFGKVLSLSLIEFLENLQSYVLPEQHAADNEVETAEVTF